jgi:L-iditol 2-dehydrogenase
MVAVKALRSPGVGRVELIEVPTPVPLPGEALVRIERVALCGSDLRRLYSPQPQDLPLPVGAPGHELIGTVEAVDGADSLRVGERALILSPEENSMMEKVAANPACVLPLPKDTGPRSRAGDDELLMAQQLGTVLYAARFLPPMLGRTAAVIGQGSAGLFWCAVLRRLGAARVIALDLTAARVRAALRFGATDSLDNSSLSNAEAVSAVKAITGGELPDLVVEACGEPSGINLAIALVKVGGRIQFFGVPHEAGFALDYWTLFRKYCTTHSTGRSSYEPDKWHFRLALELLASREVDARGMVTHHFPLARVAEAYELAHTRGDGALKVVVDMA